MTARDWQPAIKPFGTYSYILVDPDRDYEEDGRRPQHGVTDRFGRPVWADAEGHLWVDAAASEEKPA